MVATPWGDSDTLRERRMRPGPGTSPEEVARNQRERLYGATVAAVAELGYEATRVADLVEISGVSSRSFYALFPNKEACFIATLKVLLEGTAATLVAAGDGEMEWDERVRRTAKAFADMVAAQPATARFVISDAYAAGPVAWKALDSSMGLIEDMAKTRFAQSKERAGMPAELISAQIGAVQEVTRARLRTGDVADLAQTLPELMELMALYRPPPEPLRMATRAPTFGPESTDAHDDADRVLRAFALVVAENGFGGTTINEVARRGAMSPATFYSHFRDKEDAMLAAIDSVMAQMATAAMTAFGRSCDWESGMRAAIGNVLNFLASRPAMAHLLTVDIFAGGDEAIERRAAGARPLAELYAQRLKLSPEVPPIAGEAVAGGIAALVRRRILEKGTASLPALAPVCTYYALAPILGPEAACAAANGDGRGRERSGPTGATIALQLTRWSVVAVVSRRKATAGEIAAALEVDVEEVTRLLPQIEAQGLIERIEGEHPEAPTEWASPRAQRLIELEEWSALSLEERDDLVDMAVDKIKRAYTIGVEAATINRRLNMHMSQLRLTFDERGWNELAEVHLGALHASQVIQVESTRRLRQSGEEPIHGTSIQSLFELPEPDG